MFNRREADPAGAEDTSPSYFCADSGNEERAGKVLTSCDARRRFEAPIGGQWFGALKLANGIPSSDGVRIALVPCGGAEKKNGAADDRSTPLSAMTMPWPGAIASGERFSSGCSAFFLERVERVLKQPERRIGF